MRLLWITISFAMFQCNYGAEESSTVSDTQIDEFEELEELFKLNATVENNSGNKAVEKPNPCDESRGEICVPQFLCKDGRVKLGESNRLGQAILDVRIGADDDPEPERHPCPDFFEICCQRPFYEIIPNGRPDKCGVRNKNGVTFQLIARDNESQYAEFPWVVAFFRKRQDEDDMIDEYICAGSLIHPSVVLTAAHCFANATDLHGIFSRAGEWDTQTKNEPYPHQDRGVVEVQIHENYTRGSHFNDVAVVFLDEPVELTSNVNTACLPPQDFVFDPQRCFANGWGKDKFGKEGLNQVILKRIELPVVQHEECQTKLKETKLGKHFELDPSFMCAGGESGKDTCEGDGGAPLNCAIPQNGHNQYYVAGQVAWGVGCFDPIPGVYASVAKFRHWIDNVFEDRKLHQKFYIADQTF